ncbi:MAG: hypothetical protein JW745_01150 [Sedimentisphaerales bacterium]|nr:hypothetical protein [Sedimentisphaerales bacterium]MBN2844169.1 hypothetical protein [Sedimentisphaerales bacterium]
MSISDFVIQQHTTNTGIHWDLMLRLGEVLLTWQVDKEPDHWSAEPLPCRRIFDHRLKYLTYEGDISGDRGRVQIYASGQYQCYNDLIAGHSLPDSLSVTLLGRQYSGELTLTRQKDDLWLLQFNMQ